MRAIENIKYSVTCPETFNWNTLESHRLTTVAVLIKDRILRNIDTEDRNLVPGLRDALNVLSKVADVL